MLGSIPIAPVTLFIVFIEDYCDCDQFPTQLHVVTHFHHPKKLKKKDSSLVLVPVRVLGSLASIDENFCPSRLASQLPEALRLERVF